MDAVVAEKSIEDRFAALEEPEAPPEEKVDAQEEAAPEAKEEAPVEAKETDENVIELDPDAPLFDMEVAVEGGGREAKKVSLAELQKGYMMQSDYQRKTAEVAREREAIRTEVKKTVDAETDKYIHNIRVFQEAVVKMAAPELGNVNWAELAKDDPARYVELKAKAENVFQVLQSANAEVEKANNQRNAEMQQTLQKQAADAVEVLKRDVPDWSDELYSGVLDTGVKDYGFTREEMNQVTDPRAIKVLLDAKKYRALQAAKPNVEKKLVAVPKVLKPGSTAPTDTETQKAREARQALKKSGSMDAARNVFLQMER